MSFVINKSQDDRLELVDCCVWSVPFVRVELINHDVSGHVFSCTISPSFFALISCHIYGILRNVRRLYHPLLSRLILAENVYLLANYVNADSNRKVLNYKFVYKVKFPLKCIHERWCIIGSKYIKHLFLR